MAVIVLATELPYMVNKAKLIEKIAELVKDKNGLKGFLIFEMNPAVKAFVS